MEIYSRYADATTILSRERMIFISEEVSKEMASALCSLLIYYNGINPTEEIQLFIHTIGGDAMALTSIYDVINMIQAPVATIGVGKIYSAGAFILAAGDKGRRSMYRNAEVLIHGLQCLFPHSPDLDQIDSQNYYDYLNGLNKRIMRLLAKHTGQKPGKIELDSKRDLYLSAEEALKYGLIDRVL